ncbi:MAG: TolC family protein [Sphingobacteriales bacterium]|nr:MAG: TolC family protein [Sphingobacteriales bacterium]
MRSLILRFTIVLAGLPTISLAQDSVRMSVQDAVQYAAKNHVRVKNALLDQQTSLARNKEVAGLALPKISAQGGISHAPLVAAFAVPNFIKSAIAGDPNNNIPGLVGSEYLDPDVVANTPDVIPLAFQPKWTTNGTLQANQVLFDPSVMVALQARRTIEELAAKSIDLTVQDVKVSVAKAYYNVLVAEKQKTLIDQNIVRISQIENETREYYKAGFTEKIDVDRITVLLNNLRTQKIRIDQTMGLAYLALKFQMGMDLKEPIVLTDSLTDEGLGDELLEQALEFERRNEFQLLSIQNQLLRYDVKRYKLGWLPTLALFGNYGYTLYNSDKLFQPGDAWQKSALIGTSLNIPIFDGFQRRNKQRQAELAVERNENDLENLRQGLTLENETARISLRNNLLALENQRTNMRLAEDVYNTARIKYKEGVGSNLEVLDAETALKEAQTNYFTALYDVMTSRVDLQKALGVFN